MGSGPVSRLGDTLATGHGCDTTTVLDFPGQAKVFANGKPMARCGDPTVTHLIPCPCPPCCCPHIAYLCDCSTNVIVVGIGQSRLGDCCDAGEMIQGSPNVYVN